MVFFEFSSLTAKMISGFNVLTFVIETVFVPPTLLMFFTISLGWTQ